MNEILGQIIDYIRGTWRYRWFMFLAAWPICIGGWVYVQTLPDQYTASARVYVDTSTMLRPLLSGLTVRSNVQSELSLMTRTLFSRPSLEKIARMTDLDLKAKTPEQMDSLLNGLAGKIKLSRTNRDSLYRISYQDSDPDLAKRLVQAVLTLFVEGALGESRKDSDTAQRFLDQQIEEYEARLVAAENRLKEFKRKNLGRMPKDGGSYYSSLQAAMGRLEQARLELREAQNRRDELARQIREGKFAAAPGGPVGGPGSLTPELDARILNLQKRLDELLLGYTEQHPDVILTRRTIEDLEKQRQKVLEGRQASAGDEGTRGASNLIKSQLQVALSEAEATVASLRVRVREYKGRVDELKRLVNVIPEVEVQLKQLNRDYNVTKSKYEELLVRREKAAMSEKLEQSPDAVKFRVVDPPYVPPKPSGPNRPLLSSIVLGLGLAGGVVFAFFLSQLRPTFNNRRALMEFTGLPVLGGVSMIWSPQQRRRRRLGLVAFAVTTIALLGLYGAVLAVQTLEIDVLAKLKGLI